MRRRRRCPHRDIVVRQPHSFKILKKYRPVKINRPEPVDSRGIFCYNTFRWFGSGEMAEWFKALVLKTSDAERHRGLESLSLRQFHTVEKYPRGRRGSPAKGVGWDNCREGSNPSFSAI